jgi:hypothetical protein
MPDAPSYDRRAYLQFGSQSGNVFRRWIGECVASAPDRVWEQNVASDFIRLLLYFFILRELFD